MSWRKKAAIGCAGVMGLAGIYLVVEHFRGPWALKRWKQRIAAKGEVFEIKKLAPPLLEPEKNGLPDLLWLTGQLGAVRDEYQPPFLQHIVHGKAVAMTKLNYWPVSSSTGRRSVTWVNVAEELGDTDAAMQAVLGALANCRAYRANVDYHAGFTAVVNHFGRLRSAERLLATALLHDLHQHQIEAAFAKLKGALALVDIDREEPLVIAQLVRFAMMHMAFGATWHAMQHEGWTDAQLAELQRLWAQFNFLVPMERAIAMERIMASIEYERFRASDLPLSQALDPMAFAPPGGGSGPSLLSLQWIDDIFDDLPRAFYDHFLTPVWKFSWSHHDELHYYQTMQQMLDAQRKVRALKKGSALSQYMDHIENPRWGPYDGIRFVFARQIYPALSRAFHRAWIAQTTAELAATAIAIRRYTERHGKLPAFLGDLVPEFLERPPLDWMDSERLKYCLEGDGTFRLYSVGLDGRDDLAEPEPNFANPHYQNGRDLIWPRPASETEVDLWRVDLWRVIKR